MKHWKSKKKLNMYWEMTKRVEQCYIDWQLKIFIIKKVFLKKKCWISETEIKKSRKEFYH